MTELTEKKLMAGLLKAIEVQTGITLHDGNIRYFFEQWKEDIEKWRETAPDEAQGKLDEGIAVTYANKAFVAKTSTEALDFVEKSFQKWNREQNPVNLMVNDLISRGCSKQTVYSYRSVGNAFMRTFDYEPEFTVAEYYQFMNQFQDSTPGTRRVYRDILKLLWEVQGLNFPLRERRMHTPHTIMPTIPPHFSANEVANIIQTVKTRGTPEEKYYFCLATVFAPRRIELCEITAQNFNWNGTTGELVFNPHKHGNTRRHHIPEQLVSYLKEYSYQLQRVHTPQLSSKFWYFVQHLDLPVPRPSRSQRKKNMETLREKHQRPRNYGWHAFRHSLTIALSEAGINDTMISNWMGWRSGNPAAPLIRTYTRGAEDLDAKIQAKHPFIKLWGQEISR